MQTPRTTAPDRATIHAAVDALLDALEARPSQGEELIAITGEALEAAGFEHAPIVRLIEADKLRTIQIGRRRYTTRKWLAELADVLPPASAAPEDDELVAAARRRGLRAAGATR